MDIFWPKSTKNQLLRVKLLPKIIFRKKKFHLFVYFCYTLKCNQMAVSQLKSYNFDFLLGALKRGYYVIFFYAKEQLLFILLKN